MQTVNEIVGTVAYMAPEMLRGHPKSASDQYALGIMTYEWLCGELPVPRRLYRTGQPTSVCAATAAARQEPGDSPRCRAGRANGAGQRTHPTFCLGARLRQCPRTSSPDPEPAREPLPPAIAQRTVSAKPSYGSYSWTRRTAVVSIPLHFNATTYPSPSLPRRNHLSRYPLLQRNHLSRYPLLLKQRCHRPWTRRHPIPH